MKKILPFIFGVLCYPLITRSQHCPFDGSYMVVVKLSDSSGNVIIALRDSVYLAEVNNPRADSCKYFNG